MNFDIPSRPTSIYDPVGEVRDDPGDGIRPLRVAVIGWCASMLKEKVLHVSLSAIKLTGNVG